MNLKIHTLGELRLSRQGETLNLPPSKRTRALLGYLAVTARPHRRDRLCEVFWDTPDDPRASLRWSLSKLRPLINDSEVERLAADRERVTLAVDDIEVDIRRIANVVNATETQDATRLQSLYRQLEAPFFEGADLPEQDLFYQWLEGERAEISRLRAKLAARLSAHPDLPHPTKLEWAERWVAFDPYNPGAATQLLTLIEMCGQAEHAQLKQAELVQRFRNAGVSWSPQARNTTLSKPQPEIPPQESAQSEKRTYLSQQKIRFCTASDKVRIAYAEIGEGTPIVKAANWLSHLEHDWDAPIWSPLFRELAQHHRFIRYDERGNGLSDWDVADISFNSFVTDLETVVDAAGVEKFALLGISQGAAVSIEYAIRHPERVSHLVLFGGYATGWRIDTSEQTIREREAILTLTQTGWGQDNPAYRQIFSSTFMPSANPDELTWFNEFQRLTTSPENAVKFLSVFGDIDVRDQLPRVQVPTLVIHSLGDQRIPVSTGRDIAANIPGAQFVGLSSDGHLLLGRESASKVFVESVKNFISTHN